MTHKTNYAALLTNKPAIAKAAGLVGCVQTRGARKDDGSIRALLEGIWAGRMMLIAAPDVPAERIEAWIHDLEVMARIVPPDAIVPIVNYIDALRRAAIVKSFVEKQA